MIVKLASSLSKEDKTNINSILDREQAKWPKVAKHALIGSLILPGLGTGIGALTGHLKDKRRTKHFDKLKSALKNNKMDEETKGILSSYK